MTHEPRAAPSGGARRKGRKSGAKYFVRDVVIIFLIAVVVSFLVKTYLFRSFYIPSESMRDTLQVDDRVIVNELVPSVFPVERGDVVVFKDPGRWLPAMTPIVHNPIEVGIDWALSLVGLSASDANDHLIKRVIGLPGDHVECCTASGQITINGTAITEPYVVLPPGQKNVSLDPFDVVVDPGSLWVMGDNRNKSKDSRYNRDGPGRGFVPMENVVGKATFVYWPLDRWTWLDNYPDVFRGASSSASGVPSSSAPPR